MGLRIHFLATVAWILLLLLVGAVETVAQENCPAIEVNCSERKFGDSNPVKCTVAVGGKVKKAGLNYRWSLSNQAPFKISPERSDEVEIDISSNPNQTFTVTATVEGLPGDCDSTGDFESAPAKPNEPNTASDTDAPDEDEEAEPEAVTQPKSNGIVVTGSCSDVVVEGGTAYFGVSTNDKELGVKPSYKWTLSRGTIKSGQGTNSILVDTTGLGGEIITATVRVDGFGAPFKQSCRTTIKSIPKAYKLEEITGKNFDEEAVHLRRFALRLNIGLDERAYIIVTGRRGQALEEIRRRAERARDYLTNQCNVPPERIMGIGAAVGTDETIQLWVIQNGASAPAARTKIY